MLKTGKIKIYDKERGFGFIVVDGEDIDIFFHILDMPHRHILPRTDEVVVFKTIDYEGKQKAKNIKRLDVFPNQLPRKKIKKFNSQNRNRYVLFFGSLLILMAIGYFEFQKMQDTKNQKLAQRKDEQNLQILQQIEKFEDQDITLLNENIIKDEPSVPEQPIIQPIIQSFQCDGRVYCSQMKSYEEALFFS